MSNFLERAVYLNNRVSSAQYIHTVIYKTWTNPMTKNLRKQKPNTVHENDHISPFRIFTVQTKRKVDAKIPGFI